MVSGQPQAGFDIFRGFPVGSGGLISLPVTGKRSGRVIAAFRIPVSVALRQQAPDGIQPGFLSVCFTAADQREEIPCQIDGTFSRKKKDSAKTKGGRRTVRLKSRMHAAAHAAPETR